MASASPSNDAASSLAPAGSSTLGPRAYVSTASNNASGSLLISPRQRRAAPEAEGDAEPAAPTATSRATASARTRSSRRRANRTRSGPREIHDRNNRGGRNAS